MFTYRNTAAIIIFIATINFASPAAAMNFQKNDSHNYGYNNNNAIFFALRDGYQKNPNILQFPESYPQQPNPTHFESYPQQPNPTYNDCCEYGLQNQYVPRQQVKKSNNRLIDTEKFGKGNSIYKWYYPNKSINENLCFEENLKDSTIFFVRTNNKAQKDIIKKFSNNPLSILGFPIFIKRENKWVEMKSFDRNRKIPARVSTGTLCKSNIIRVWLMTQFVENGNKDLLKLMCCHIYNYNDIRNSTIVAYSPKSDKGMVDSLKSLGFKKTFYKSSKTNKFELSNKNFFKICKKPEIPLK